MCIAGGRGAGCLAEGLWIGLRSVWLQLWAECWSACQPLYGNEQGQSQGAAGQEFSSMFLQRAAVCKPYFSTATPITDDSTFLYRLAFANLDGFDPPKLSFCNISASVLLQPESYSVGKMQFLETSYNNFL